MKQYKPKTIKAAEENYGMICHLFIMLEEMSKFK